MLHSECLPRFSAQEVAYPPVRFRTSGSSGGGAASGSTRRFSTAAIAGIAVGCIVVAAACIACIVWFCRRKGVKRSPQAQTGPNRYHGGDDAFGMEIRGAKTDHESEASMGYYTLN
jgi:hypothetical protein